MKKNSFSTPIHISLPLNLLEALDLAAAENYSSRSEYIRECVVLRLKGQRISQQKTGEEMFDKYLKIFKSI